MENWLRNLQSWEGLFKAFEQKAQNMFNCMMLRCQLAPFFLNPE